MVEARRRQGTPDPRALRSVGDALLPDPERASRLVRGDAGGPDARASPAAHAGRPPAPAGRAAPRSARIAPDARKARAGFAALLLHLARPRARRRPRPGRSD